MDLWMKQKAVSFLNTWVTVRFWRPQFRVVRRCRVQNVLSRLYRKIVSSVQKILLSLCGNEVEMWRPGTFIYLWRRSASLRPEKCCCLKTLCRSGIYFNGWLTFIVRVTIDSACLWRYGSFFCWLRDGCPSKVNVAVNISHFEVVRVSVHLYLVHQRLLLLIIQRSPYFIVKTTQLPHYRDFGPCLYTRSCKHVLHICNCCPIWRI